MPTRIAKLKSSWLADVSYNDETQILTVTTAKGTKHEHQVPPHVFQELLASESPGKYYNSKLRNR